MTSKNDVQLQQRITPKSQDLATPTADAAELASTLQKMPMNVLFGKAALFTGKWILRPIFWWPIKYYFILMYKMIRATPRSNRDDLLEMQQKTDTQGYF